MHLYDLSVRSKTRNTCGDKEGEERGTLPSSRNRGNGHYSLPLAMLLYRLANRLSRSQVFILSHSFVDFGFSCLHKFQQCFAESTVLCLFSTCCNGL
jgi:hypothetical protein